MNDLPLLDDASIILIALIVIGIVFLIGLAVGDWHGYRRRKHFEDEISSSFDLDLTLYGKSGPTPIIEADDDLMTNVYKSVGSKGRVIK